MKPIQKYTAIKLGSKVMPDDTVKVKLSYGDISGAYYPTEEFDTEREAIEYGYEIDKWARWLILPVITFNNFED
jgi:hypothetical protein